MFLSTVIAKRHEANVVETEDGITIIFRGFINTSRASQNGFPSEVVSPFFLLSIHLPCVYLLSSISLVLVSYINVLVFVPVSNSVKS